MAPGNAMKESETDEEYLISMARNCQKHDPYFTKSWILTAKTLFPDNFGIQYEAYCLAKDNSNIKEASSYLEDMFRKFLTEHRLWEEVYKIANALRADSLDAEGVFLRGLSEMPFSDTNRKAFTCSLALHMWIVFSRSIAGSPSSFSRTSSFAIPTMRRSRRSSSVNSPYWHFLACSLAAVKNSVKVSPSCLILLNLYLSYARFVFGVKCSLNFRFTASTSFFSSSVSENVLYMLSASGPITVIKFATWTSAIYGCSILDVSKVLQSLSVLCLPGIIWDSFTLQVFYCTIVLFLHALYNYGRHINPSWFPGAKSFHLPEVQCILLEGARWTNVPTDQPKHKKRKLDADGKDMEPPTLTVSKCIPTEAAVVLTQSFLTAIRCWSILQFLKKGKSLYLSRLSQQIRMEEWPWFQSFLVESLIYQDLHKEAIAKLYQAAEVTKDPTVKIKVNLQLASCFHSLGEFSAACSKLLDVVCSLPETSVAAPPAASAYHPAEALHRKSDRKLVFACYDRGEILRFCMKSLITCFKEKVLMQFTKDDLALGHLIVMTQYDWPEEEQLFLKLLEIIKKQGSFCYGLFFNYIINADMLEEFMYITTSNGGGVTLDLLPTSTSQVGRWAAFGLSWSTHFLACVARNAHRLAKLGHKKSK
ncbi:unnamed protein product [Ixodes persulcatus]